jgi:predicted ABC-type transport system involved in lysophospholipase L1 biosynthesis ATPase subunit
MDDVLVRASKAARAFGEGRRSVAAIREASFEVRQGERIALIGPSGSGKSTLLHLIAALDHVTSGSIEWPALGPAGALRPGQVSLSFQGPGLLPPLSVEENVALPLLLAEADPAEAVREARDLLERMEMGTVMTKLPEELSGGQAQRASLARALVGRPRLVLADEPTGQQDRATGQRAIDVLMERVATTGAALIVATHDRSVAERLPIRWSLAGGRLDTGVARRSG